MICPECGSSDTKKLKESMSMHGDVVTAHWYCNVCKHAWTTESDEEFFPQGDPNSRKQRLKTLARHDRS